MQDYLYNLALIEAVEFCKEQGIDCSGTHLVKEPRKQSYSLNKEDGHRLVGITFHKNSVPTRWAYKY